ncbi:hypothetical protein BDZ97DRAFT_1756757 [Flammula alnicola]|nr:hypothetical protein BDZ97DRAFT_1756757 [Flammula alnicola]
MYLPSHPHNPNPIPISKDSRDTILSRNTPNFKDPIPNDRANCNHISKERPIPDPPNANHHPTRLLTPRPPPPTTTTAPHVRRTRVRMKPPRAHRAPGRRRAAPRLRAYPRGRAAVGFVETPGEGGELGENEALKKESEVVVAANKMPSRDNDALRKEKEAVKREKDASRKENNERLRQTVKELERSAPKAQHALHQHQHAVAVAATASVTLAQYHGYPDQLSLCQPQAQAHAQPSTSTSAFTSSSASALASTCSRYHAAFTYPVAVASESTDGENAILVGEDAPGTTPAGSIRVQGPLRKRRRTQYELVRAGGRCVASAMATPVPVSVQNPTPIPIPAGAPAIRPHYHPLADPCTISAPAPGPSSQAKSDLRPNPNTNARTGPRLDQSEAQIVVVQSEAKDDEGLST